MKQLERFKLHATKRVKDKIAKFSNARKLNDGVMLVVAAIQSGGRWDAGFIGYVNSRPLRSASPSRCSDPRHALSSR